MCEFCNKENKSIITCPLIGNDKKICLKCCFAISIGQPDMLRKIKSKTHLTKDDVLCNCLLCLEKQAISEKH